MFGSLLFPGVKMEGGGGGGAGAAGGRVDRVCK